MQRSTVVANGFKGEIGSKHYFKHRFWSLVLKKIDELKIFLFYLCIQYRTRKIVSCKETQIIRQWMWKYALLTLLHSQWQLYMYSYDFLRKFFQNSLQEFFFAGISLEVRSTVCCTNYFKTSFRNFCARISRKIVQQFLLEFFFLEIFFKNSPWKKKQLRNTWRS